MEEINPEKNTSPRDMRSQVMRAIQQRRIRIRHPLIFLAQKLGLQSALALIIFFGAIVVSALFYFLKKTGILGFFKLGWPGFKVVLLALPYNYIGLFLLAIFLAYYLLHNWNLFHHMSFISGRKTLLLFGLIVALALFFANEGIKSLENNLAESTMPKNIATKGKIIEISEEAVEVEEDDGNLVWVVFDKTSELPDKAKKNKGRILRAVGERGQAVEESVESDIREFFYAKKAQCCENE